MAKRKKSVQEIMEAHWKEYGRNFFTRYVLLYKLILAKEWIVILWLPLFLLPKIDPQI